MALEENKFFKLLREEASTERAHEAAKNFIKLGVSLDIIKKGLNLSDSELDEIQKELVPVNG